MAQFFLPRQEKTGPDHQTRTGRKRNRLLHLCNKITTESNHPAVILQLYLINIILRIVVPLFRDRR